MSSNHGSETPEDGADDDVIDVEVIETSETVTPQPSIAANNAPKKSKPWGWMFAGVLVVFIGGIFSAPYAREGLVTIGLLEKQAAPTAQTPANLDADTKATIDDLKSAVSRLTAFTGQQEAIIQTLSRDLQTANSRLEEIANREPVANGETVSTSIDTAALDALQQDVTRLSEDVSRLASIRTSDTPSTARIDSALAVTNAETAALRQKIADLESALEAVESGRLETSPRGRLILLLSRIKDKAFAGLSFGNDLDGLRADLASLPALDQQVIGADLLALQETGGLITPFDTLLANFDTVATDIVHAQEKSDGSFLQKLFTVRRRDAGATGVDAVLYDAEKKLLVRDIEGAVEEIEALEGAAKEAASTWLAQANTHLKARAAFDSLIARISGRVGA